MKTLIVACVLLLGLACAPKSANLSPAGQAAYTADQIVLRLGELQDAAIAANKTGSLDKPTTGKIVLFTVDGAKTAKGAPAGWKAIVSAGWKALRTDLGVTVGQKLGAIWTLLDSLLGGA